MFVKVSVSELGFDPQTNVPVMVLKEENGKRAVPIWIGVAEAGAIAAERESAKYERPLTHDLMKTLIDGFGAKLTKVTIDDLKNNTFYAKLFLQNDNKVICIDARPSDAVALALRCNAPIFVEDHILDGKAESKERGADLARSEAENLRRKLREIDPGDFGKYSIGEDSDK